MREIADAADLSPANLYHYFRGKDEILFYCQDQALDRMLDAVRSARRMPAPPADQLRDVLTAHVRTLLDDVEGGVAHLEVASLPPRLRARIVQKRDRYEHALRQIIRRGIVRGALVPEDPSLVARAMLGALNWTAVWFDRTGPESANEVGAALARFLVRGVSAKPDGRPNPRRRRRR